MTHHSTASHPLANNLVTVVGDTRSFHGFKNVLFKMTTCCQVLVNQGILSVLSMRT